MRLALLCLALVLAGAGGLAAAPRRIEARRATQPVTLDGQLDEPDWQKAQPVSDFWEIYPADRGPADEKTEYRFLFDERYLYAGVRAFLKDPSRLRMPFVRRDKVNATMDYVQIYIDPQNTHRGAYLFRTNARGSRADAFTNEATQTEINDPDYDWEIRTQRDPQGWTAEFRIPFSTLHVPRTDRQLWSFIAYRGVPRDQNTQMASTPIPRSANCFLCYANTLVFSDLEPKVETLLVSPSIVGGWRKESGDLGSRHSFYVQPSLDAKWLPFDGAALDLTIKPDFSEVEADTVQLTSNTRFAINLPEKRPFFRDGIDLVTSPSPDPNNTLPVPTLYTRTIVAPNWGARATYRSGLINGTAFLLRDGGKGAIVEPGFLSSQTILPDFNATVGFLHTFVSLGKADGGIVVSDKQSADGSFNQLAGGDARWSGSEDRFVAQLFAARTHNPDRSDLSQAWQGQRLFGLNALAEWDHTDDTSVWTARYMRFDSGFRSWLGFVPRVGYQDWYARYQFTDFLNGSGILSMIGPYAGYERLEGLAHSGHEGGAFVGIAGYGFHNLVYDFSVYPDAAVMNEQGDVRRTTYGQWSVSLNPVSWLPVLKLTGSLGQMVDFERGDVVNGATLDATLRIRPADRIELEGRYAFTRLGGGLFSGDRDRETITGLTAIYYFDARLFLSLEGQLSQVRRFQPVPDNAHAVQANLQFTWEMSMNTAAYWGVRYASDGDPPDSRGRSIEAYLKISHTLRY